MEETWRTQLATAMKRHLVGIELEEARDGTEDVELGGRRRENDLAISSLAGWSRVRVDTPTGPTAA